MKKDVIDVALVFLLLTLNSFSSYSFASASTADFEQVNVSWNVIAFNLISIFVSNVEWNLERNCDQTKTRHLLAQSQQWKHQNNVWNMLKARNKDTSMTT